MIYCDLNVGMFFTEQAVAEVWTGYDCSLLRLSQDCGHVVTIAWKFGQVVTGVSIYCDLILVQFWFWLEYEHVVTGLTYAFVWKFYVVPEMKN